MNHHPVCYYSIQGDLQCQTMGYVKTNGAWGAFNAQGEVEKVQSFDTINMQGPKRTTNAVAAQYASASTVTLTNGESSFVGLYKKAF